MIMLILKCISCILAKLQNAPQVYLETYNNVQTVLRSTLILWDMNKCPPYTKNSKTK